MSRAWNAQCKTHYESDNRYRVKSEWNWLSGGYVDGNESLVSFLMD